MGTLFNTYCTGDSPQILISCPSETQRRLIKITGAENGSDPKIPFPSHHVSDRSPRLWFNYAPVPYLILFLLSSLLKVSKHQRQQGFFWSQLALTHGSAQDRHATLARQTWHRARRQSVGHCGHVVSDVTTLPALTEHLQVNGGCTLIKLNLHNTVGLI